MDLPREQDIYRSAHESLFKRNHALRFSRNRRAISTVIATVFFLGIAISVALALFMMSSTYNNLYQQQLQVREDRLREMISIVAGGYSYENVSNVFYITSMTLTVKNTGSVTAHVVSVYYNDVLVDNSLSNWVAPVETTDTGLIVLPPGTKWDYYDRITVSTDRGTTSTKTWIELGVQPPGPTCPECGGITPYQFMIVGLNPMAPERHGGSQFTLFQRQYFYYVINQTYLDPIEYIPPSPSPPKRFIDAGPNATSYDPQAVVGVRPGIKYAIWMEEFQLEQKQAGGNYTIKGIRWAHYNVTVGPYYHQIHPVVMMIPLGWPTFTYTIGVVFEPTAHIYVAPPTWAIIVSGAPSRNPPDLEGPYGGTVTFSGGTNYENLKGVTLTLHLYNASNDAEFTPKKDMYGQVCQVTYEDPSDGKLDGTISIAQIVNGSPSDYSFSLKWKENGAYYIVIEGTGKGETTNDPYSGSSTKFYVTITGIP